MRLCKDSTGPSIRFYKDAGEGFIISTQPFRRLGVEYSVYVYRLPGRPKYRVIEPLWYFIAGI